MNIFRRFGLGLALLLFSLCLSALALFISIYPLLNTPAPLKQALSKSGIYTSFVQNTVTQDKNASLSLPMSDPGVQQALEKALPPSFVQSSSEEAINSIYSWIQGNSAAPAFSIDLSQVRSNFADNLASYAQQKLDALPACTQFIIPPTSAEELLSLTCLPYGVSPAALADAVRQEALGSNLLAGSDTINANSLKNAQGEPLTDQLVIVPKLYSYYRLSFYMLPVLLLLSAIAIICWSMTKREGIKRIAWRCISTGIAILVLAAAGVWLLHMAVAIFGVPGATSTAIQDKILIALETLVTDLRMWWFGLGGGYTVCGIVILIILKYNKSKPMLAMGRERDTSNPLYEQSKGK